MTFPALPAIPIHPGLQLTQRDSAHKKCPHSLLSTCPETLPTFAPFESCSACCRGAPVEPSPPCCGVAHRGAARGGALARCCAAAALGCSQNRRWRRTAERRCSSDLDHEEGRNAAAVTLDDNGRAAAAPQLTGAALRPSHVLRRAAALSMAEKANGRLTHQRSRWCQDKLRTCGLAEPSGGVPVCWSMTMNEIGL